LEALQTKIRTSTSHTPNLASCINFYTAPSTKQHPNNPTTANMSNSIQDQNMAETKANDTPVEAPIEKGKGKAADDTMDDDEDDSESGEVSCASSS
jgi:hypothetical protein